MEHGVVIVGASVAGYNVAKELRKKGFEEKITLVSNQAVFPYNLYPLSKDWMLDQEKEEPPYFADETYFKDENIHMVLNTEITELLPEKHLIVTNTGEKIPYDKLVIAIGSTLRTLKAPGSDAKGIFYLRNFDMAHKIKQWDKTAKDLVIVGAGFIGLEMASTFSQIGMNVTVIEHAKLPLERIVGSDASHYFTKMHEDHGVKFLTSEDVTEFKKDADGKVTAALTASGKEIPCQMAIIGIGVVPNISLTHPDLKVDRGIIVNEYGETSLPDVYAAGDCTVWPYNGNMIHVEHWEHARAHGRAVAHNIIQPQSDTYNVRPYFWTDEYDQTFEYLGHALTWDRILVRGSLDTREFSLAYVDKDNYPIAILFANNSEKRGDVEDFMDQKRPIDEAKFSDRSIPFSEL